jgi:tetratricopeptide (TPR) repeat protein
MSREDAWTAIVERARDRLATRRARIALRRRLGLVLLFAMVVSIARIVVWPLTDHDALLIGVPRALVLGVSAFVLGSAVVWLVARRRPSVLQTARELDAALGLPDVIGSGVSLSEDGPFEALARRRAAEALAGCDVAKLLPHPRVIPSAGRVVLGGLALLIAAMVGGYERSVVTALTTPPTSAELAAAEELAEAARALVEERDETRRDDEEAATAERSPEARAESLARAAQRALARGDRERALQRIDELRRTVGERSAAAEGLDRLADQLARHLDTASPSTPPSPSPSNPSGAPRGAGARPQSAEEQMRLLARRLRDPSAAGQTAEERERTLERLARSADEARRSGRGRESEQLAEALSRAQAALAEGRAEDAARALEEAAARADRLSEARERAASAGEALARLLERAGLLERAVQLARLGEAGEGEPGEGMAFRDGEGEGAGEPGGEGSARGLAEGLAARLAALGLAEGPPGVSHGPGGRGSDRRTERSGLPTHGDVHARSQVREGERAVGVLRGLGRNAEAEREYADVYPSYGAVAEDALSDERIPAARREAVRRYFEAIRPE